MHGIYAPPAVAVVFAVVLVVVLDTLGVVVDNFVVEVDTLIVVVVFAVVELLDPVPGKLRRQGLTIEDR